MPYKSEKISLSKKQDRRRKLTDGQKLSIIKLYKSGGTFRGLARIFLVDRRTIKNIVFPDFYKKQLKKYSETKHSQKYYDREKHNLSVKKHRQYKQKLYLLGQLKGGEK